MCECVFIRMVRLQFLFTFIFDFVRSFVVVAFFRRLIFDFVTYDNTYEQYAFRCGMTQTSNSCRN